MAVTQGKAETWVIVSAATVGGCYAYLKWQGKTQTPVSEFVTAWGVVFFSLSLVATAVPGLAGGLALIIMTSDLLGNMPSLWSVIKDSGIPVQGQAPAPAKPTSTASGGKK